ncbi:MAG TPA: F0F1 ATP synthase subunit delta [Rhizomicrobium sp.]|nr:F0F1 ATP synthase subunit delta [Rhizomicrobium sp.]
MATERAHESGLPGRYANAVFELAQEEKSVDAVDRDFVTLRRLIEQNPDLARLVRAPVFSREDQARVMKSVLEEMGAAKLTTKFILTVTSKRRLFVLLDIIRSFEHLLARLRGEVQATVISARTLSDSETVELKAVLKAKLGRDPRLETKVDPALLGGLVVKVGSRMIDSSLRTKLTGIRAAMRGN